MMKLFRIICSLCIASTMHPHNTCVGGFQLSMVASSRQRNNHQQSRSILFPSANTSISKPKNNINKNNVPSTLISNLACMALKRRLSDPNSHVECDLTAIDPNKILFGGGHVGPVTVKGRSWKSPLGLTCRAITATVTECQLDMGKVISKQKLVLNTPALGSAMVALSDTDFGNFITHPLMKPPSPPQLTNKNSINGNSSADNNKLLFLRENVALDPSSGIVTFYGTYAGSKWKFLLQRNTNNNSDNNEDKASIHASLVKEEEGSIIIQDVDAIEKALTKTTSKFFNEMDLELDGTFLSFNDMQLTEKGDEPSVMISLRIKVIKFPSPGLEF